MNFRMDLQRAHVPRLRPSNLGFYPEAWPTLTHAGFIPLCCIEVESETPELPPDELLDHTTGLVGDGFCGRVQA